jgi:hypothetical protein
VYGEASRPSENGSDWCWQNGPTPNGKRRPIHEERWATAGKYDSVEWHTFRHTCRSGLHPGTDGMQQKPMRQAQIPATMSVYGNVLMGAKREVSSKAGLNGTEERMTMQRILQTHEKPHGVSRE